MIIACRPLPTRLASIKWPVTPLSAALTDIVQTSENTAALSPVFATRLPRADAKGTSRVKHKFFICHSYKKHPGWGILAPFVRGNSANCASQRHPVLPAPAADCKLSSVSSSRLTPNSFRIRTYAKLTRNPIGIRTSKTQDLKPFRIRTYEKTPRGVPPSLSLLLFPPSAIIIGLALPPGSATLWPVRTFRTHDAA
jgi:hypothetical protein